MSAVAIAVALATAVLASNIQAALLGLAVAAPFALAWIVAPAMMGGSDVKLTAAAGLAAGWPAAAGVVLLALGVLLAAQALARVRGTQAPTVYCAGLAAGFLLVFVT